MTKRPNGTEKAVRAKKRIEEEQEAVYTSGPSVLKGDIVFKKLASVPTSFLHPRDAFAKMKA